MALPSPQESADEARRRAEEILSRPEFRQPPKSWGTRFSDFVAEVLARLASGLGAGGAVAAWILVVLVAAAVVVVVVLTARSLQRDASDAGVALDEVRRPAADWRADAARHESAGAWRDALRCHWRALVADLAARGLVEEVPGRTTGEYRRHVGRSLPGAARDFAGATALFELAWYARQDIVAGDVAEERRLGAAVLAEAGR